MSNDATVVSPVPASEAGAAPAKKHRGRGAVAWVLVVITSILLPLAVVAFWGQRTLTDSQRYIETVGPLIEQTAIKDAVVQKTTATIMTTVKQDNIVGQTLDFLPPAAAQKLEAPIEGAIESLVTQVTTKVINSEQFAELWTNINEKLQKSIIAALEGNRTGAVTLQGDEVVLDTSVVAEKVQQELVNRGLTVLEGKQLPPAADQQIVLLQAKELKQAQIIYSVTIPLTRYLIPALAILVLAAVFIGTRRARIVMGIGIGMVIGISVLSIGLAVGQKALAAAAPSTLAQQALNAFWTVLTKYLATAVSTWLTAGVIIALLGWFSGRSRPATKLRGAISGSLAGAGRRLGSAPLGGFLSAHWRAVFIGISVLGLAAVLLFDPVTVAVILWTTVVCLALCALVYLLAAAGTAAGSGESEAAPTTGDALPTS